MRRVYSVWQRCTLQSKLAIDLSVYSQGLDSPPNQPLNWTQQVLATNTLHPTWLIDIASGESARQLLMAAKKRSSLAMKALSSGA